MAIFEFTLNIKHQNWFEFPPAGILKFLAKFFKSPNNPDLSTVDLETSFFLFYCTYYTLKLTCYLPLFY